MFSTLQEPARLRREAMKILTDATHSDALTYQTYTVGEDAPLLTARRETAQSPVNWS